MSEEGFFSRWSRRKRAAEADREVAGPARDAAPAVPPAVQQPPAFVPPTVSAPPPQVALGVPIDAPPDGGDAAGTAAEPPFDISSLPAIESLTAASDIRAFLRKEVPEALKRAALRRAWSLDPAIRDFVGPADYAWDYNAPDGVPGGSLELVGDVREMLAQVFGPGTAPEEPETAAPQPATEPQPADAAPEAREADAPPDAMPLPDEPAAPASLNEATPDVAPERAPPVLPSRRHGSALPS